MEKTGNDWSDASLPLSVSVTRYPCEGPTLMFTDRL